MARKQAKRRKPAKKQRAKRTWSLPVKGIAQAIAALAVIGLSYQISARLLDQPIQAITIDGPFQRVTALQIEAAIGEQLSRGFLSANLELIQAEVVTLPWIDAASVTRRWPGTLEIRVTEQVPAAVWGERGLLNTRGELFVENARHVPAELPRLSGPEDRSGDVAARYLEFRDALIPLGLDLRSVTLDARGAWSVTLHNGVDVRLGRRAVDRRIDLFIDVVANFVASREADIEFVDMRYGNGFTIRWKDEQSAPAADDTHEVQQRMVAGRTE